jgi:outer membrane protein
VKYPVRFFVIILITISSISKAENLSIVYLDMEKAMNQSIVGKSLNSQLDKIHKANLEEFKINEEDLKKEEVLILSQKNVLSEEDYKNKVNLFKEKLDSYKKKRQEKIDLVTKKKLKATSNLLKEINPILSNYSKENGISIILRKQDIVLARTDLDITKQIIEAINLKIKKIDLN